MAAAVTKEPGRIRAMFAEIAPRYDLLNHLLSANRDRRWRRRAASLLGTVEGRVLDLAAGTCELASELARAGYRVVAADFCYEMLALGQRKWIGTPLAAADGLRLPFPDDTFGAVTIGFGIRNFEDPIAGLAEIRRILKPGGLLAVLEFSRPRGLIAPVYRLLSGTVIPFVGGAISGSADAYRYLDRSIGEWPDAESFAAQIGKTGFREVRYELLSGGIAAIHTARNRAEG